MCAFEFSLLVQVWALRRLSNGLEGVPWHSRTCSGNHQGHRCSCDAAHGMADDTNTRASISRIIMLAEALFEVQCLCRPPGECKYSGGTVVSCRLLLKGGKSQAG